MAKARPNFLTGEPSLEKMGKTFPLTPGEIKHGHIRYSSYGGAHTKKKKKNCYCFDLDSFLLAEARPNFLTGEPSWEKTGKTFPLTPG